MNQLHYQGYKKAMDELLALANCRHKFNTRCYFTCIVNEVQFHTKGHDDFHRTQNSGLLVEGEHEEKMVEFSVFLKRVVQHTFLKKCK